MSAAEDIKHAIFKATIAGDFPTVVKVANDAQSRTPYTRPDPFAAIMFSDGYPAEEEPIDFMVRPLMWGPGRPPLIVGPGGIGKTFVVQQAELALENGVAALGGLVPEGPPRRTLHIDADQGIRATRRRFRRLAAGMGVQRFPALLSLGDVLRTDPTFHPTDVAKWRELFKRFDLIVFDALASLISRFDLDENSTAECRSVIDAIQEASDAEACTAILIAHTGKDYRDSKGRLVQQTDPRGASGIKQAAGVVWSFTGDSERGAVRTARRTREAADDDGDDELVAEFHYRIEKVHSVITPGMKRKDGEPICGLIVTRTGPPTDDDEATEGGDPIRSAILATIARHSNLRSGNDVVSKIKGRGTGNRQSRLAALKQMLMAGEVTLDGVFRVAPSNDDEID